MQRQTSRRSRTACAGELARSRGARAKCSRFDGAGGNLGKNISPEVLAIIANLDDAGRLADLSASNLELKVEDAQSVLDIAEPVARLRRVNDLLSKEIDVLTVQQEINTQARADIDRSQREYFLRQQLKAIQARAGRGQRAVRRDRAVSREDPEAQRCRRMPRKKHCGN